MSILLAVVIGYLLGSIPFGVLAARRSGRNIQQEGSGNIGATNALRVLGPVWGALVLAGDAGKGILSAYIGARLAGPDGMAVGVCGAAAGHAFSLFLRGRGGKIVSTSLGAMIFLDWRLIVPAVVIFLLVVLLTRYVSLGSIIGGGAALLTALLLPDAWPIRIAVAFLFALLVWRHQSNIQRLLHGTERKLGTRA